ncbi:MAG: hypothetical protein RL100_461 [Actinomycetota bacterium]|jgi:histone H3/H4
MSQLLKVAAALRGMSDAQLEALITMRMVNTSTMKDFFDLAEALSKPNNLASTIAALPKPQVLALRDLVSGEKPNAAAAEELHRLALVGPAPTYELFESTAEVLAGFDKKNLETKLIAVTETALDQARVDRDCGVEAFETSQAITELIFDLEQRYVREVGRKTVGLPDLKRLANHLRKTTDYAREIYELASLANLIVLNNGRWQLNRTSESWLSWSQLERSVFLSKTWRAILGDSSAKEISKVARANNAVRLLPAIFGESYPLADSSMTSKITKLTAIAALIGLSSGGAMSSWLSLVLAEDFTSAGKLISANLPVDQDRIIVQADLSIIAPGPLPTEKEIMLRRFADTEQIGLASTYRLSALSLSHGLETGLEVSQIRKFLNSLSDKSLPQPVEYLINEAEQRFGRLVIKEDEAGALITSTDAILLAEIINEQKLKPFDIRSVEDGALHTRFEPEVVYFALRELGFVAIRQDSRGLVISPRVLAEQSEATEIETSTLSDVKRLREHEARVGHSPDDDDLQRQIQLAIKNKAKARFTVTSTNGDLEFLLEPIGIANGRLRAKDRKADIERTLPLASIIKVVLE